jgi:hypothetical protein
VEEEFSIAALARMIAADTARAHRGLGAAATEDLAHRLETALRTALQHERRACVAECERRRNLWTETEEKPGTPPSLRAEARFRGNEAAVLADALRARSSA